MKEWNEKSFISWVQELVDTSNNLLGHGEDAVATQLADGFLVVNIDGWVASTDRPDGMALQDCGFRAVANAVSDVIVKGAKPDGMMISLSMPNSDPSDLKEIVRGFSDASKQFDVPYLGGDLNQANDIVIDVTVWGRTNRLIKRSGAQLGDKVCWLGPPLGHNAAALGILTKNWVGDIEKSLSIMGRPQLFPEFLAIDANSSIDSSDGVAKSLYLLANASQLGIELDGTFILNEWVRKVAMDNDLSILDLIFYGGEELGVLFTIPSDVKVPENCIVIGQIVEGKDVWLDDERLENRGWEHFSD